MERKFCFTVTDEYDGAEIMRILKNHFGFSHGVINALKQTGCVVLNGNSATVRERVKICDTLEITLRETEKSLVAPCIAPLDILYEDADFLVVNKCAGVSVHPSPCEATGTLANAVCAYMGCGFVFRTPTRLDKATSGAVLIAKNAYAASANVISKEYFAIVDGTVPESGVIDAPIAQIEAGRAKRAVADGGKAAVTRFERVKTNGNLSLVRVLPETGRTHQIRLHFSHIGHPILGDFLYGGKAAGRLYLHCSKIVFMHPFLGETAVECPMPDGFEAVD